MRGGIKADRSTGRRDLARDGWFPSGRAQKCGLGQVRFTRLGVDCRLGSVLR